MRKYFPFLLAIAGLTTVSCEKKNKNEDEVVAQRFIHRYGYDVSKDEWENSECPGQVVTTLRDGITITATYEQGLLHGPTTYTHPHTHTRESVEYYDRGTLTKKVSYSIRGIPLQEELFISPTQIKVTKWFKSGTPMSIEEFVSGRLYFGEFMDEKNNILSRIESGCGERFIRDAHEKVVAKETYEDGVVNLYETYYSAGKPHLVIPYNNGIIQGERKEFAETGEPIAIEPYADGKRHGMCSYFQNGSKFLEVSYVQGNREGAERHYVDGETLIEETYWSQGVKHGPSTLFYDGLAKTAWFYNNKKVAKTKFDELSQREQEIAEMHERSKANEYFE